MAKRRKVANLLALAVLSTVTQRPMHPYEIASLLRARGKDEDMEIKWGSLYTVVHNLAKHGFIEVVESYRDGARPERTIYRITDAGRAELRDWARELVAKPQPERPRFKAGLSVLAVLPPEEATSALRERLAQLERVVAAQRASLAEHGDVPRLFLVEVEYELAVREAEVAWLRGLLDELTTETFPDLAVWRKWHATGETPSGVRRAGGTGKHREFRERMMSKVRSALVIGGGVAGPVAALALRKAGIDATLYEAYPSSADGIGGTLAIAPNGLAALDVVGARDTVTAARVADHEAGDVVRWQNGRATAPDRGATDAARAPKRPVPGAVRRRGGRRHPVRARQTAGDDRGRSGWRHRPVRRRHRRDGRRADRRGRCALDRSRPRRRGSARRRLHRACWASSRSSTAPCPAETGTMFFAFGKQAYHLYWRRPDGRTGFGANLPQDRPMSLSEARAVPAEEWVRLLRDAYGDDDPGGDLVRAIEPDRLTVTGSLHIMPSVPRWHRGRVVLVGDAVHAPSNSSGQGASLAIESAIELARCLRDLPDAPSAFATYERLRRPRVERIAARAAKINHMKAPGPLGRAVMPF